MIVKRFVHEYLDVGASQYAGMLAFSLFVALLPLLLGILTVWGFLARRPSRFLLVKEMVIQIFPGETQHALSGVILGAGEHAGALSLVSMVGLLWFSSGLFSTIGFVLNRINEMPNRMFIEQRVRGLWLAPALFIAVVVAASVNLAVKRRSLPVLIGVLAIWIALAWLIGFLYRLAPSRRLARADVIPGAALAAAAIVGLSYVFPFYAQLLAPLGSGEQLFAAALGLIAWLYLIAQALLAGALFNRVRRRS